MFDLSILYLLFIAVDSWFSGNNITTGVLFGLLGLINIQEAVMGIKEAVVGGVLTVIIGGTAYTVNKEDVVNNFADDTGLTQQQAEDYVNSVDEEELIPYDKLGADYVKDGNEVLSSVSDIDCANYDYEWETPTLSCEEGKDQLEELGRDEIDLGNAYIKLSSESASSADITATINILDEVNDNYEFEIVDFILDANTISESKNQTPIIKQL